MSWIFGAGMARVAWATACSLASSRGVIRARAPVPPMRCRRLRRGICVIALLRECVAAFYVEERPETDRRRVLLLLGCCRLPFLQLVGDLAARLAESILDGFHDAFGGVFGRTGGPGRRHAASGRHD